MCLTTTKLPGMVRLCPGLFNGDLVSKSAEVFCKLLSRACLAKTTAKSISRALVRSSPFAAMLRSTLPFSSSGKMVKPL